jgi:endonuclease/exonuclease/phosphatase family metal-dependent hydrolase
VKTLKKLSFLLLIFIFFSCSLFDVENDNQYLIMSYNVQNLFDQYDNGNEYPEFTTSSGWNYEKYKTRVSRLAEVIVQNNPTLPSVVMFQEIENEKVLEDLLTSHLGKRGFKYYSATNDLNSPIQVGIISRYPIVDTKIHAVQNNRSILECTIDFDGSLVILFNYHAKSRLGGVEETESLRIATSEAITIRYNKILNQKPFLPVIVAADFNQSADNIIKEGSSYPKALIVAGYETKDDTGLVVTGSKPNKNQWYTWWLDQKMTLLSDKDGSYYYNGRWESFDQILLSHHFFDGWDLEFVKGEVRGYQPLVTDKGIPNSYNLKTTKGYSDHLPVTVLIKRE